MQTPTVFRFHELGFATKVVAGAMVIIITWLSLPLGFLAFGAFLFLHLLLDGHHAASQLLMALLHRLMG